MLPAKVHYFSEKLGQLVAGETNLVTLTTPAVATRALLSPQSPWGLDYTVFDGLLKVTFEKVFNFIQEEDLAGNFV